jgi:hypothetical protein
LGLHKMEGEKNKQVVDRYTLNQLIPLMKELSVSGVVSVNLFDEIPRLTGKEYEFNYLRGFIEGVMGW